jgi:O-glycosyl hydrolase
MAAKNKYVAVLLMLGCALVVCMAEVRLTLDFSSRAQTIDHIGSSTGMHGDHIARHWDAATVDAVADLLFSRGFAADGAPKGIGLSSFRIQIGAGAAGEKGGIKAPWRRTDCFLRPDGTYDWEDRGRGVRYWREKTAAHHVPTVIGYLNSPPVQFTQNGYGFKTEKTFTSNLKPEHYPAYAAFLAAVADHFQSGGMPFTHISPVNEPQWFWTGIPGSAKQEGSPWTNEQIARLTRLIDQAFSAESINTKVLIPEAAEYPALHSPLPSREFAAASDQVRAFWSRSNQDYLGDLAKLEKAVAGHAYFSDGSIGKMIHERKALKKAVAESDTELRFWQTEYCLLGKGWTGGLPPAEVDEMTAALLLARNIHADLTIADASAWQWWSSTEPKAGRVPRYCLIECGDDASQTYRATKLLWALGHYSRFVRPGMVRIEVDSEISIEDSLAGLMASAYYDAAGHRWVMVMINMTDEKQDVRFRPERLPKGGIHWTTSGYVTDRNRIMKPFDAGDRKVVLPPKSIVTIVSELRT